MSTQSMTLYAIEETLTHLTNAVQMVEVEGEFKPAEDDVSREEIGQLVAEWLQTAKDKRDAVGQFQIHCESQAALAAAEIKRLQARKKRYESAAEQIDSYVLSVIMAQGRDAKDKLKKLEGNTLTFSAKKCPDSVNITDAAKLPARFKMIGVEMPLAAWEELTGLFPDIETRDRFLMRVIKQEISIDKRQLLTALKAQAADLERAAKQLPAPNAPPLDLIEGAEIAPEKYYVKRD